MTIGPAPLTSGDYSTNSITSGTTMTLAKPTNLADGDTLFIWVMQSANSGTFTPPAGWTTAMSLTGRKGGLYYLKVPTAASVGASFTLTTDQAGTRMAGICFRQAGIDATTPIDVIASSETAGVAGVVTIAAVSPTGGADFALALVYANPGSSTGATFTYPSGWANEGVTATATNGTASSVVNIGYKQLSASGSTGTVFVSGTGTPSGTASPSGLLLTLTPGPNVAPATASGTVTALGSAADAGTSTAAASGTVTATGSVTHTEVDVAAASGTVTAHGAATPQTFLQQALANTPVYIVHHGGEVSFPPQNTAQAYALAHAWNPNTMFEAPVIQCSTGEYVLSETATTDDYTTVVTISTSSWATLSALRTSVGGFPMMRLKEDFLDVYGTPSGTHPLMVDNKLAQNDATLIALLNLYGGAGRIMAKANFANTSWASDARAAGFLVWGWYADTDQASFAGTHTQFDYLGLNYGGTQSAWTQLMGYLQPVFAHILQNAGARAIADGKATTAGFGPLAGYMISDVTDLIPHTASAAANGTVTANGSVAGSASKAATVTGAVTAKGSANGTGTSPAAASGTVTASGTATAAATAHATVTGTVTATGTTSASAATPGSASGTVTAFGSAAVAGTNNATAAGQVTANGSAAGTGSRSTAAAGQVTATGSASGFVTAPAAVLAVVTALATAAALGQLAGLATATVTALGTATPEGGLTPGRDITVHARLAPQTRPFTAALGPRRYTATMGQQP